MGAGARRRRRRPSLSYRGGHLRWRGPGALARRRRCAGQIRWGCRNQRRPQGESSSRLLRAGQGMANQVKCWLALAGALLRLARRAAEAAGMQGGGMARRGERQGGRARKRAAPDQHGVHMSEGMLVCGLGSSGERAGRSANGRAATGVAAALTRRRCQGTARRRGAVAAGGRAAPAPECAPLAAGIWGPLQAYKAGGQGPRRPSMTGRQEIVMLLVPGHLPARAR
jgi:hypothetical protein